MKTFVLAARCALLALSALCAGWATAQVCAVPQNNGTNITSTAGQVVNGYFTPNNGTYTAGSSPTITMSGGRGSATWAVGDMALLIQMQCVDMNGTDSDSYGDNVAGRPAQGYLEPSGTCRAGQYEYVPAGAATSGTSFVAGAALQYTYVQANPTSTTPRRSFQVMRVPQYGNFTLGGTLSGLAWNGTNGGVIAVDVAKTLNFNGQTIDMGAQGFRGGGGRQSTTSGNNPFRASDAGSGGPAHASKGEGIAGTPRFTFTDGTPFSRADNTGTVVDNTGTASIGYPGTGTTADFDFARGAPGNAGGGGQYFDGGYHNGGGGGGANGGAGGRGGFGWRSAGWAGVASDYSNIETVTGQHLAAFGGAAFGGAGVSRVVLGGGGGAGDQNGNSNSNNDMSGSTGGGIVVLRAGALTGSGTIDVRGGSANTNPLNDAAGAGAAGGSAVVISPNWTAGGITVNAGGGQGGDAWLSGTGGAHSGGGGGGGGVVVRTGAATADVSGGANGVTNTSDNPPGGADHGALPGNSGVNQLISTASDPVTNAGYLCLPITDLSISKVASTTTLSVGQTSNFTLTIGNTGPQQATSATVIDVLPPGLGSLTFVSASGTTGATTLTSSSITGTSTFNGTVTIPVNQTLTIVLRAIGASNGSLVNASTVTAAANASDTNLTNNLGTATVVVGPSADLSVAKAASTPSLVVGGTTNFTLTFVNAGPSAVTGALITDTLPSSLGTLTFISATIANASTLTSSAIAGRVFTGTVTLPVASTLTVVLRAVAGTIGAVLNTATIAAPSGTTDANTANNTGTAIVNVGPQADLSVSKSVSPSVILDGQTTLFTVVVRNLGPNTATGATFNDTLPSGLSGMTILATSSAGGATITAQATSSSQANATMTLPANSSISFSLRAIAGGVGQQVNAATVSAPAGVIDPVSSNNSAFATVTIPVSTNLSISKTNTVSSVTSGSSTVYGITVSNGGPNSADGAVLIDPTAAGLNCSALTCSAAGGAVCPSPVTVAALQGSGLTIATMPASSSVTFLLTCGISATGF